MATILDNRVELSTQHTLSGMMSGKLVTHKLFCSTPYLIMNLLTHIETQKKFSKNRWSLKVQFCNIFRKK